MRALQIINIVITVLFVLCYAYQGFYMLVPWFKKDTRSKKVTKLHDFAVLICARNESLVIKDLLRSLKKQTYPQSRLTVFVMADNCSDNTAEIARKEGAHVYERFDLVHVGKGFALQALMNHIREDYPDGFDGYFVFDADNVLSKNFIELMNDTFARGNDIVSSYRNSKNYGDNWISAGYALCYLRDSRYLNHARHLLGVSCSLTGTGFLFSQKIADEMGGWCHTMLIEDIEFSIAQILKNRKIVYCPAAELYDEQPIHFRQSCRQRMRWSKGYVHILLKYGGDLVKGMFNGNFACFDLTMVIAPAFILTFISLVCNIVLGILDSIAAQSVLVLLISFGEMFLGLYFILFLVGLITTFTEWKHIHTSNWKKILYAFTFPIFMFTYVPIAIVSLFTHVTWKPIEHTRSIDKINKSVDDQISQD